MRTDIHAPSNFNPGDYVVTDFVDMKEDHGSAFPGGNYWQGHFEERGGCDHCGAHGLRYAIVVYHQPSETYIVVGRDCAERFYFDSREALRDIQRAEREAERRRRQEVRARFREEYPDVAAYLDDLGERPRYKLHPFLADMLDTCARYDQLTEAQAKATRKFLDAEHRREQKRQEREAATEPIPTGQGVEVEGEVVKAEWRDNRYSYYGAPQLKVTVRLDGGGAVWGTAPKALRLGVAPGDPAEALPGKRVRFVANVETAPDKDTFGFFKRPRKAEVLETTAA